MPKKIPINELLRLACIYAESDRESFVSAYSHMPSDPAALRAKEIMEQIRAYRLNRWGMTSFESAVENAELVPFGESPGKATE